MQASKPSVEREAFQSWLNTRWASMRQSAPWLAARPPPIAEGVASIPERFDEAVLREVLERGGAELVIADPATAEGTPPAAVELHVDVTQSLALARAASQPRVVLYPTAFDGAPDFFTHYADTATRHLVHERIWVSMEARLRVSEAGAGARALLASMRGTEFFLVLPRP
jgi:hypothetical protein